VERRPTKEKSELEGRRREKEGKLGDERKEGCHAVHRQLNYAATVKHKASTNLF
jgi:hypothetical protein